MAATTRSRARRRATTRQGRPTRLLPVVRDLPIETIREHARLNGAKTDAHLARSITGLERELSLDGANVLTLHLEDEAREILRSPLLEGAVDLDLGAEGRWRWDRTRDTGGLAVAGTQTTLRMWCLPSALLRAQTTPLAKSSTRMDLAGWVAHLARERAVRDVLPGLRWVVPAPGEIPAPDTTTEPGAARDTVADDVGWSAADKRALYGMDHLGNRFKLSVAQVKNADVALRTAHRLKASPKATKALLLACMIESKLQTGSAVRHVDHDSRGILQIRDQTARGMGWPVTRSEDVAASCTAFLERGFWGKGSAMKLARDNPSQSAGWVAQQTQGSAFPARYDRVSPAVDNMIRRWGGGASSSDGGGSRTVSRPSMWRRGAAGKAESSWTALDRVARQLGRRRFIALPGSSRPRLVVAADQQLIQAQPHLELYGLDDSLLVEAVQIDLEGIKHLQSLELTALASGWSAPPGGVVDVRESGPVDGPWLVQRIVSNGIDPTVRVTLQQPTTTVEQAAATSTAGSASSSSSSSTGGGGSKVDQVFAEAKRISNRKLPYGPGGHGQAWAAARKASNMDCSSSTSVALHAAGLMRGASGPRVSDWFLKWGNPGRGNEMTVWVKPGTGPNGHVLIQFHRRGRRFDTGSVDALGRGPRLRSSSRSYAGMQPRHWPGT
ncbi:MAG: hypothetical protein M0P31_15390 [Solirubrobacteraceae bacterium]|nr:hypothetical protein [Solirubrobacteraceae bacterium]